MKTLLVFLSALVVLLLLVQGIDAQSTTSNNSNSSDKKCSTASYNMMPVMPTPGGEAGKFTLMYQAYSDEALPQQQVNAKKFQFPMIWLVWERSVLFSIQSGGAVTQSSFLAGNPSLREDLVEANEPAVLGSRGSEVQFGRIDSVALFHGKLRVADRSQVLSVSTTTGETKPWLGSSSGETGFVDGVGTLTTFGSELPAMAANPQDPSQELLIVDRVNHCLRVASMTSSYSAAAPSSDSGSTTLSIFIGVCGSGGDNIGRVQTAKFEFPTSVAGGSRSIVYVGDQNGIKKVSLGLVVSRVLTGLRVRDFRTFSYDTPNDYYYSSSPASSGRNGYSSSSSSSNADDRLVLLESRYRCSLLVHNTSTAAATNSAGDAALITIVPDTACDLYGIWPSQILEANPYRLKLFVGQTMGSLIKDIKHCPSLDRTSSSSTAAANSGAGSSSPSSGELIFTTLSQINQTLGDSKWIAPVAVPRTGPTGVQIERTFLMGVSEDMIAASSSAGLGILTAAIGAIIFLRKYRRETMQLDDWAEMDLEEKWVAAETKHGMQYFGGAGGGGGPASGNAAGEKAGGVSGEGIGKNGGRSGVGASGRSPAADGRHALAGSQGAELDPLATLRGYRPPTKTMSRTEKEIMDQIKGGNFRLESRLGRDSNGTVSSCVLGNGTQVAVKEILLSETDLLRKVDNIRYRLDVIAQIRHPNVVRYYGAWMDRDNMSLFIFMEHLMGGSLAKTLRGIQDAGTLPEVVAKKYALHAVQGLACIHSRGIVHRDLSPEHLHLTIDGTVKIAEYGDARYLGVGSYSSCSAMSVIAMPYFTAPELLSGNGSGGSSLFASDLSINSSMGEVAGGQQQQGGESGAAGGGKGKSSSSSSSSMNPAGDIWALGITIATLLNKGRPPWPEFASPAEAFRHITDPEKGLPLLPTEEKDGISAKCASFLTDCCQRDPTQRPTANQLLMHSWFTQLELGQSLDRPFYNHGTSDSM